MVLRFETLSNRNPVYADRKRTKNMESFSVTERETCSTLRRRSESSSVYPLITITMRRSVIILSFVSIAHKLREKFANIGLDIEISVIANGGAHVVLYKALNHL